VILSFIQTLLILFGVHADFQDRHPMPDVQVEQSDTIKIRKGTYFLTKSLVVEIPGDTFFLVTNQQMFSNDSLAQSRSRTFYDTLYKKLSRKKITRLLYPLAFVEPQPVNPVRNEQVVKSTTDFESFKGKVIRNIRIVILSPFGTSIFDTLRVSTSGAGRALNNVHLNTRKFVIKRNLLFKKGDRINPAEIAENQRILKDLDYIDDARILLKGTGILSDSVDVTVIAKDVWSIGIDIPGVTVERITVRLYDANFLGLGDRLTVNTSADLYRAPFFLISGLSYKYSNIGGSFIDGIIEYSAGDEGGRNFRVGLNRSFLTNQTKWGGGLNAAFVKDIYELTDSTDIISFYNQQGAWFGKAFPLKNLKNNQRIIVTAGIYLKQFTSRPLVTIDSNRAYYNQEQFLTSVSFSSNNYYLTEYVSKFGKVENLPYGALVQITAGLDHTDYYLRFYSGARLSAGNYFRNFGFLEGYLKFGGFLNRTSFEDAVFKVNLRYFTPLYKSPDKRFKFRAYLNSDYRTGINLRSNNLDAYDANLDFRINKVNYYDDFYGTEMFYSRAILVAFTPWNFYGFNFALTANFQIGLVAQKHEYLFQEPFFSGIGLGVLIKNDNLVFPPFQISATIYPSPAGNLSRFQYLFSSVPEIQYYDFVPGAPYEETLGN